MADEPPTPPKPGPPLPPQPEALLNLGFRSTVADGQPSGPEDPTALQPQPAAPIDAGMEQAGDFIGSYKLIERLGVGGFGVVWRAEQHEPIHREVALKLIKPGMDSREIIARFEAERQALALMDHPNIASVLDAGATARGRPYFVMELVKGVPITKYCDAHKLTIRERLELFIPVCQAVQHAHQKAILHRDLKPSNILVTEVDGKPVPKVIDFGVAKALGTTPEEALKASLLRTMDGMVVGTPQYMSPEQAGSVPDVDTRSDIYTLGVILYELLTGQTPVTREHLRNAAFHEVLRLVRQGEARRPSSGFMPVTDFARTAAQMRHSDARKLSHAIRGDLDWIVLKALEKDRARRYETANAFALDLRRHLEDEPVSAGPPSVAYWLGKLARRHKVILGNATAALLVIAAFAVWFVFNVTHEREVALGERDRANAASIETAAAKRKTETALIASREAEKKAVASEKQANEKKAELDRKNAEYRTMLVEAARSDRLIAEEKLRTSKEREAFAHLARACEYDPPSTLAAEKAVVALNFWNPPPVAILGGEQLDFSNSLSNSGPDLSSVQFSPDGKRVVTALRNQTARVWDVATGQTVATLAGHEGEVSRAQFSPDGTRIVTASDDKTARVWDAATGKTLAVLAGHKEPVSSAQFSPDGSRVVTGSYQYHHEVPSPDNTARLWDAVTGKTLAILAGHKESVSNAQFSPDGLRVVTGSADKTARVWNAATGKTIAILVGHKNHVFSAQFSPNGSRILTTSRNGDARVWDARTGKAIGAPFDITSGDYDRCGNAQFSPDGKRIVSPSWDHEKSKSVAHVRDAATGKILVTYEKHGTDLSSEQLRTALGGEWTYQDVSSAQFSPDGTRIVTASDDKTARVWDAATGQTLAILAGHEEPVASAQFSPDGSRIVTVSDDKTVRVWDAVIGRVPGTLAGSITRILPDCTPDGTRVVTRSGKTARVWDTATGESLAILAGHEGIVVSAQFSPDGKRVVTGSHDRTARVWDTATGERFATLAGHEGWVWTAQFSPDGKRVLTTGTDSTARVWDVDTYKPVGEPMRHEGLISTASFSPDGSRIVTGAYHNTAARVWNAATGTIIATLAGHGGDVLSAEFSPDGKRVVTGSHDTTARVWDASTGAPLAILVGHEDKVTRAHFSPDSSRIVTSGADDNTARVWEAATGKSLATFAPHDEKFGNDYGMYDAQFSPDGSRIVTRSNTMQLWDAATGKAVTSITGPESLAGYQEERGFVQFILDVSSIFTTRSYWTLLLPTAGPPPEWFPDFLRYMAQMRLNSDGELEPLTPDAWRVLQERMRALRHASAGQDTPYLRILRRFVPEWLNPKETAKLEPKNLPAPGQPGREVDGRPAEALPPDRVLAQFVISRWLAGKKEAATRNALALQGLKPEWLDPAETSKLGLPKVELEALNAVLAESLRIDGPSRQALDLINILMGKKEYGAAYKLMDKMSDARLDDADLQNELAWRIATGEEIEQRDLGLAEKFAVRANAAAESKSPDHLDTLARVLFMQGKKEAAIRFQAQAVTVAKDTEKAALQKTLDSYRRGELPKP